MVATWEGGWQGEQVSYLFQGVNDSKLPMSPRMVPWSHTHVHTGNTNWTVFLYLQKNMKERSIEGWGGGFGLDMINIPYLPV